MKLHTENEQIIASQYSIIKLRDLYLTDNPLFNQMQDYFPFHIYVKSEKTHDYKYVNNSFLKAGAELESLFLNGKKRLLELSDKTLLKASWIKSGLFFKQHDKDAVLSCPQKIIINKQMTPYLSNKSILDNEFSINMGLLSSQFCGLENFINELTPNPNKEAQLFLKFQSLTKREKEILELICKGYKNKEISDLAFISVHTVRTHRNRIWKKLDIKHFKDCLEFQPFVTSL